MYITYFEKLTMTYLFSTNYVNNNNYKMLRLKCHYW